MEGHRFLRLPADSECEDCDDQDNEAQEARADGAPNAAPAGPPKERAWRVPPPGITLQKMMAKMSDEEVAAIDEELNEVQAAYSITEEWIYSEEDTRELHRLMVAPVYGYEGEYSDAVIAPIVFKRFPPT